MSESVFNNDALRMIQIPLEVEACDNKIRDLESIQDDCFRKRIPMTSPSLSKLSSTLLELKGNRRNLEQEMGEIRLRMRDWMIGVREKVYGPGR